MPRIDAPTVAEHHDRRRRALLDAARALLAETGQAPTMAALARRAGLARSSVYQYFTSPDDLMQAVVADVFPDWATHVRRRVENARTPGEQVWAYVEANVDLFAGSERAVAQALSRVVDPDVLRGPMQQFHAELQVPLRDALAGLGEPNVAAMAEMIDSMIVQASRGAATAPEPSCTSPDIQRTTTLNLLRSILSGYLNLD